MRQRRPWTFESIQGKGNVHFVTSSACGFGATGFLFDCAEHVVKAMVSSMT